MERSGFRIRGVEHSPENFDAEMIDENTIAVGWVSDLTAWTRTLRIGGTAGPERKVTKKAWQIRIVPEGGSYRLFVLKDGRLYLWGTNELDSHLLVPHSQLVKYFDAIPSELGPICVSTAMQLDGERSPDVVNVNVALANAPPTRLTEVRDIARTLGTPPSLSMEGGAPVVRVIGPVPDSTIHGSPEERVQEFHGTRTRSGWTWTRSNTLRFADASPGNLPVRTRAVSFAFQRDLGVLIYRGRSVEWMQWTGDATISRHVRIAPGVAGIRSDPRISTTHWSDSTAVFAWVDYLGRRSSQVVTLSWMGGGLPVGDVQVALASPDGSMRRIALDGLPKMVNATALKVLHSGNRTIFVWVRSLPPPPLLNMIPRTVSIEACAIPDARLRSQKTIPFD